MKKALSLLLVVLLAMGLVACGKKDDGSTTSGFEIALVTDVGNIDDQSFNQSAWEAVKEYAEANGKTYAYYRPSEDSTEARVEQIENAIEKGAKVIVCPGYLFEEALYNVQDKHSDIMFLLLDGEPHSADYSTYKTASNVHNILYKEEQPGFFAGYAAVKDGYKKLGFLGGMAVPAVVRYGYGFVQGANLAAQEMGVSDIVIDYDYAGAFSPSDDLASKMAGWYSNGTEVVFACGGSIYQSVLKSAEAGNGKVIGVDVDQGYISPLIITSAMKKLKVTTIAALTALYGNNLTWPADYAGTTANLGAADDAVGLPTDASSWRLNTFTVEEYTALYNKVVNGQLVIDNSSDPAVRPAVTNVTVNYHQDEN